MLELIARNDRAAPKEFISACGSTIWSMAKHFTNSQQEAEDLTAEIFMDVWRCAAKFESSGLEEEVFVMAVARCRLRQLMNGTAVKDIVQYSFSTASVLFVTL